MSVTIVDKKEFENIITTLKQIDLGNSDIHIRFFTQYQLLEFYKMKILDDGFDEIDLRNNMISCFVDRLYIANQLAYLYHYKQPMNNIDRLNGINAKNLDANTMLDLLKLIRYNLGTNEGTTFFGIADHERLNRLIEQYKDKVISENRQLEENRLRGPRA